MSANGNVYTEFDNTASTGIPASRLTTVYAVNGTIQSADEAGKDAVPLQYGLADVDKISTIKYEVDVPTLNPLNSLIPELVYNNQAPYQLNYAELVPVLVNTIKELSTIAQGKG